MDLKNISLFKTLGQKMTWLNERQKVLAQNLANANTPGYISKDLKKVSFQSHLSNSNSSGGTGLAMQVDEPGHIQGLGGAPTRFEIRKESAVFLQATPDGNSVDLEAELAKMAETQMEYTMATNLYRKHVGMLKTAVGRR